MEMIKSILIALSVLLATWFAYKRPYSGSQISIRTVTRFLLSVSLIIPLLLSYQAFGETVVAGSYAGGNGTIASPYKISNLAQLRRLSETTGDWDKHFELTNNIDASDTFNWNGGNGFSPIGNYIFDPNASWTRFTGSFDGNGKVITNLTINRAGKNDVGLFGNLDASGLVKNVGLENVNVLGNNYVGALVGQSRGKVISSYSSGSVMGGDEVGGLVGRNEFSSAEIQSSYSTSSVTGNNNVGGLLGGSRFGTVRNSYSTGRVDGNETIGGLIGYNESSDTFNCYATGYVTGNQFAGALIGNNPYGNLVNCYWNKDTAGLSYAISIGNYGGETGLTSSQMIQQSSFSDFDFANTWKIYDSVTTPFLPWQDMSSVIDQNQITYSGGDGSSENPYQISNLGQLLLLSETPSHWSTGIHFKLIADIDAVSTATWNDGLGFSPIGNNSDTTNETQFLGSFNGNSHVISNLTIDRPSQWYVGLFGGIGSSALVHDLQLEGISLTGYSLVGGLIGINNGTVTSCYLDGNIIGSNAVVGGLVGINAGTVSLSHSTGSVIGPNNVNGQVGGLVGGNSGTVVTSYSTSSVSGQSFVGGLAGTNNGSISFSYSTGSVVGRSFYTGGLVGQNGASVYSCYAIGSVSGDTHVGGLVGRIPSASGSVSSCYSKGNVSGTSEVGGLVGSSSGTISTSYATGLVSGSSSFGGLLGINTGVSVTDSYWDTQASGQTTSDGGTGLLNTQMIQQSSFSGFDFANTWKIWDGVTTPFLSWQDTASVFDQNQIIYSGGDGSSGNPYQISNLGQLLLLSETPSHWSTGIHFKLSADIDAVSTATWNDGLGFSPIGKEGYNLPYPPFNGSFNANGHVIRGLTINRPYQNHIGLFGYVGFNSSILNVVLEGVNIVGAGSVGGLVGSSDGGKITNSCSMGTVAGTGNYVGGLVGYGRGVEVTSSCSRGTVSGGSYVGGLLGALFVKNIESTYYEGTVNTSYSNANVDAYNYAGGLVGYVQSRGDAISNQIATVSESYSTGNVDGVGLVLGGLIGELKYASIISTYWNKETSNRSIGIKWNTSSIQPVGLTSAQMVQQSSFTGFDFTTTPEWLIREGETNPYLPWQVTPPYASIGAPSLSVTNSGPVTFSVIYTGADTVNLDVADIELIATGDATGTVSVTDGTTSTPTVSVTDISGEGTIGIAIKPGTATNTNEFAASYSGPSTPFGVDVTAPVITLTGANPQIIEFGNAYTESGATASDNYDGDISGSIVIDSSAVNTTVVGSYTVTYNVSDAAGNAATEVARTVNVVDNTPPVITLTGANPQEIEVGGAYTEPGATASDNYDGDVTRSISITGTVNTSLVGSYTLTYNVSDAAGNAATEATRTVNVVDTTVPVITLTGANPQIIEFGDAYTELGATASDNYDGDITGSISITGTVNTSIVGSYTVKYNVMDAAGNAATEVTRTVNVVDTTPPTITLTGDNPLFWPLNSAYVDPGATASDNYHGDISGSIVIDSSTVNTSIVGSYTVTYNVTDSNSNAAVEVTRTVNVVEDTSPLPEVYVDFLSGAGGNGSAESPYNTVADGVERVISGGVIRFLAGSSSETPTITKAMTLEAQNGLVRIGSASADPFQMTSTSAGDTGDSGTASDGNASGSASVTTLIAAGPDDEENGEAGIVREGYVYALALPAEQDALGSRILEDDGTIALRLHSDEAIDKDSVTAYGPDGTYELVEGSANEGTDLWVLITPSGGVEVTSASASGSTNSGSTVDSGEHVFVNGSKPASVPGLPAQVGVGDILLITPQKVYSEAQTVLVPVPEGVHTGELTLYYYHTSSDSEVIGWYPSDHVLGFMQSGSAELVEQDGALYYSVAIHHGAIVQLGYR